MYKIPDCRDRLIEINNLFWTSSPHRMENAYILSPQEWIELQEIFHDYQDELLFSYYSPWGFSLGMSVSVADIEVEHVLTLTAQRVPEPWAQAPHKGGSSDAWDRAKEEFGRWVNSDRNKQLYRFYGLGDPLPASRYAY